MGCARGDSVNKVAVLPMKYLLLCLAILGVAFSAPWLFTRESISSVARAERAQSAPLVAVLYSSSK